MTQQLMRAQKVHFVGIGGAGMSAIAKVLLERGRTISGSDLKRSRAAILLEAMGTHVRVGHDAATIDELTPDAVVISAAIRDSNPEVVRARELGIEVIGRGRALADLLAQHRSVIVAGTHGKTTTTSMIVSVLLAAGKDPTYLVGGGLNDIGTNARSGRWGVAIAESDESDGSFLLLAPDVAVITNVEVDHVDHWKDERELRAAFESFMRNVSSGGTIVVPAADDVLLASARATGREVVTFSEGGIVNATEIVLRGDGSDFVLVHRGERVPTSLQVPGLHNVQNALAAAAASLQLGISAEEVALGLQRFRGVERRFEIRGRAAGITVIDDYAHHPTEVKATLAAARRGTPGRVVAVFQPHRYSRTQAFAGRFGESFGDADRIVITDVYGAGEDPVPGVTGKVVADAVCRALPGRSVAYFPHRKDLVAYLGSTCRSGDAVLTLGAGDITSVGEELLAHWSDA